MRTAPRGRSRAAGRSRMKDAGAARRALVEYDELTGDFARLQVGEALVDLFERHRPAHELVELELSREVPLDVLRHVDAEPVRAHVGALDALLHEELETVHLDAFAE